MKKKSINVIKLFSQLSSYISSSEDKKIAPILLRVPLCGLRDMSLDPNSSAHRNRACFLKDYFQLADFLHLSVPECLIFIALYSVQIRDDSSVDWRDICAFLRIDPVSFLENRESLYDLQKKGLIYKSSSPMDSGYIVNEMLEEAMRKNKSFRRKKEVLDRYQFCGRISRRIDRDRWKNSEEIYKWVAKMEQDHKSLTFVKHVKELDLDIKERTIFYRLCHDYMASRNRQTNIFSCLTSIIDSFSDSMAEMHAFVTEEHPLQEQGLVEICAADYADNAQVKLTEKGCQLLLEGDQALMASMQQGDNGLVRPESIKEKHLYFSGNTSMQLAMLKESLTEENTVELQCRLEETGMPKGITALLQGAPGTGKTEAVMQLAKATGRSVYHVDISACKSKWFGESEQVVRNVFNRYRAMCKQEKLKPILLFNEADAVFSRRRDVESSNVAQTENAIQNILLEELENLDGILIATTNMVNNFDNAFARRFLFKVQFDLPTTEAKTAIWKDKLSWLSDEQAIQLAQRHDLSGGEINNVARKSLLEEVINGKHPDVNTISQWCSEERFGSQGSVPIGFVA